MAPATMYTTPWCPYCIAARELLLRADTLAWELRELPGGRGVV